MIVNSFSTAMKDKEEEEEVEGWLLHWWRRGYVGMRDVMRRRKDGGVFRGNCCCLLNWQSFL